MADEDKKKDGEGEEKKKGGHSVIIVKKGKKGHGGAHGGAWKVAYADFVTAMMALFIVLWILSQSEEVKEIVAGYFQDPIGFQSGGSLSIIEGKLKSTINERILDELVQKQEERAKFNQMSSGILSELQQTPGFTEMLDNIVIEFIEEGMRIELLETEEDVFFSLGTADLNDKAREILRSIGKELGKLPNTIIVEGHTDARPFGPNATYTNYELSADRANSARRELLQGGMREDQMFSIRGYADNKLRYPEAPLDFRNRRISIIVRYSEL